MFCPNCGKSDQSENSYCRSCGEYLNTKGQGIIAFGGRTPRENINSIIYLSLIAGFLSLIAGISMYITKFNAPLALYFGAAILLCNSGWHVSNAFVSWRLKRRLNCAKGPTRRQNERNIRRKYSGIAAGVAFVAGVCR